ncbi:two-component system sensor histidine kinase/response regulator [Rhodospirillum rubrum]|uniref:sensor histidine kinase n=1 Tax=Rhodospirillum rubrum TaxID=1085 RepID=UPI001904F6B9|nr:response regulator [Rhodospirillum rubrum]MBK1665583.1 two-component system sensor histidine kinase/response regulator [Rhodospirillum rubrum]MBK1677695.1 two-component system sensor histidine kinase/response regulator [Rhodospirillum rubrum]
MNHESPRVLYIDDDPGTVRLAQKRLERHNLIVEVALSAREGLARIDQGDIDVVALDHEMPGGTGMEVLSALAEREDAPPVVYVTGTGDTGVAVAAMKAGASDYVVKDVGGAFLDLLSIAIDQALEIAQARRERSRAEREIREAKDRAEILLREVNHRVANSLALVAALVRMQGQVVEDPKARAALEETWGRIVAVGGIHRRLYTSEDVRFVGIDEYLKSLVADIESAMTSASCHHTIRVDTQSVLIPTDKAVSVGVIVSELLTNACKYAYPEGSCGEIRLRCRQEGAEIILEVEDFGQGRDLGAPPRGTGLGTRIMAAMAKSLGSEVTYAPVSRGTRAQLRFPL